MSFTTNRSILKKDLKSSITNIRNAKNSDHVITETTSLLEKIKFGLRSTVPLFAVSEQTLKLSIM